MTTLSTIPAARKPDEDIFDEVSTAGRTALYRLYGAGDELIYVGISDAPAERMREHARDQPWWPEVARKTAVWYPYRAQAETAETIAIGLEQPKHNKAKRYVRLPELSFDEATAEERQPYGVAAGERSPSLGDGQPSRGAQGVEADAGRWHAVLNLPAGLNVSLLRMCVQALAEGDGTLPGDTEVLLPADQQGFCALAKRTGIERVYRYKLHQRWIDAHTQALAG